MPDNSDVSSFMQFEACKSLNNTQKDYQSLMRIEQYLRYQEFILQVYICSILPIF